MPRQKKSPEATEAGQTTGQTTANGHTKWGEKTHAVKEALKAGIESPKAIADHLRQQGIEITPAHVSAIKGKLGRAGEVKPTKKQVAVPQQKQAAPALSKTLARNGAGLSPEDLVALANLAERAGGFERLQEFLSALKGIR